MATTIVVQRVDRASLLLDNADEWSSIGRGLVVYVSFHKGADTGCLDKVAKNLLDLPVLPPSADGQWGDGNDPVSFATLCKRRRDISAASGEPECHKGDLPGIMLVPQAGLVSSHKRGRLQYHGQLDPATGRRLYAGLVAALRTHLIQLTSPETPSDEARGAAWATKRPVKAGAEVPPARLFSIDARFAGRYSTFDASGLPLTTTDGETLSKGSRKKLAKIQAAHAKKHSTFLAKGGVVDEAALAKAEALASSPARPMAPESERAEAMLASGEHGDNAELCKVLARAMIADERLSEEERGCLPKLVVGTFGNRQGLRLDAGLGPFTHTFVW
jgi:D-Tyr-tRNAtyr deacylase